ncbi:uncharacterized protein SCHCODRAFT_02600398 [Schizophyllum commune H4-8]|uniref:uncharacterized protein n=1 Tax=Schizophyllum commune (strain H4-8 / FGSC 9210) TaxID=578458 RepID=UPI00215E1956|nr:uncharacterized protein SCHCODRAFT_02600398 [Schizophyllum commune H4-8]KAI5891363.1 hypothetical protein SCHCODRAFT_02600398 [Schizophyllum commune H4-8]
MATTTQILFNSPALHSLKREQLVKLCKVHSLKANGKNTELIDRLKQYAQTLPQDAPLSISARKENGEEQGSSEEDGEDDPEAAATCGVVRPIMERIDEVDEKTSSSRGTLSSMRTTGTSSGEFGSKSSATSVGSSIKALASSLGLKRALTSNSSSKSSLKMSQSNASLKSIPSVPSVPKHVRDELLAHARPYSSIPPPSPSSLPQTDHFTFDPALASNQSYNPSALTFATDDDPLPGHVLRPGQPAPEHARLSLGQGPATPSASKAPTTTLRLVSNPGGSKSSSWDDDDLPTVGTVPATPQLKPFHTTYDLIMDTPAVGSIYPSLKFSPADEQKKPSTTPDEDVEMPGAFDSPTRATSNSISATSPTPEPFIFGSPNPKHRVSDAQFSDAARKVFEEMNKRLQAEGGQTIDSALLGKLRPGAHSGPVPVESKADREIKPLKRTSISRKFDEAHAAEFEKMESIKDVADRRAAAMAAKKEKGVTPPAQMSGQKRKSSVLETEGAGPSKRPTRPSNTRVISNSRRNLPGAFGDDSDDDEERPAPQDEARAKKPRLSYAEAPQDPEEQARKEREREAVKRRLEVNKARRRSSAGVKGRASIGKPAPKAKPSRFGFFSAAKSVVTSVWNRGKTAAPAPPSNIPKPAVTVSKPAPAPKKPSLQPTMPPPSSAASKSQSSRVTSSSKSNGKDADTTRASITSNSGRVRSPIPPFSDTGSKRNSAALGSMGPPAVPTGARARNSSMTGASSMGTRTSTSNASRVSSLGTKGTLGAAEGSRSSRIPSIGSSNTRNSTSSRLLAPTASSLAKQHAPTSTTSKLTSLPGTSHLPRPANTPSKSALNPITNVTSPNPRPGGIFSSGIPMPSPPKPSTSTNPMSPSANPLSPTSSVFSPAPPKPAVARKPTITRKPRISRGRVIAKLASQRAAAAGRTAGAGATPGKTRSSLGARVARQSLGTNVGVGKGIGAKGPRASIGAVKAGRASAGVVVGANGLRAGRASAGEGPVLMSARKRARQSEYMRRKSRAATASSDAMDVDG